MHTKLWMLLLVFLLKIYNFEYEPHTKGRGCRAELSGQQMLPTVIAIGPLYLYRPPKLTCISYWPKNKILELDQVYCAWLIKWIIKGEIIQLCLTKWWIISGTSRYWVSIRRYCLVLGGTGSVKTGTAWYYMVQGQHRACMPVYIGKSGDLVGCYRCLTYSLTDHRI